MSTMENPENENAIAIDGFYPTTPLVGNEDLDTPTTPVSAMILGPTTILGVPPTGKPIQQASNNEQPKAHGELTVRLIFPNKDGGMLIGKDGRHINMLKEATSASWTITRTTAEQEDRIVIISGSINDVVDAVYFLAEHINKQQQQQHNMDRSRGFEPHPPVLRFLFPFKSIGAILGMGGSRATKLRAETGITRFHIFEDSIPFTQERIVEMGGSSLALKTATMLMLRSTESTLRQMQETSTLYQPVKNGLLQMIARDSGHRDDLFTTNTDRTRAGPKHVHTKRSAVGSDDRRGGDRKRSRSLLRIDDDDDYGRAKGSLPSESGKKSRRMSDNSDYRRDSARSNRSRRGSESSSRSQRCNSYKTPHSRDSEPPKSRHCERSNSRYTAEKTENKLVISDSIAGRLIGRNGCCLTSLQERSGAKITLSPRIQGMPDRVVTMTGSHEQVNKAYKLIKTTMRDFEHTSH
ncbi:RNA binding protein, heterogenous nuclear RNP-K like protein [Coemansia sp. RSA 1813]|nr:RNA binding protein, heterogenous nuclear RNP-K like protein [Coemansia sp. RSA 1843]KAJ2093028.1 RNA binding protein, heterogenous nuclear RNP-K like protein [Coemansia sp. RSA 986]KAJ2569136.1 RNA binding protein, heterogenous nuclear RNP-K like protein [Coemansia sp. RSA 1813]